MQFRTLILCIGFVLVNGCTNSDDGDSSTSNSTQSGVPTISAIADQAVRVGSQTPVNFSVNANDPNGLELTYEVTSAPTVMDPIALNNALDPTTHDFSWDSSQDNTGDYDLTFTVTNSNGESASTTVTVSILSSFDYGGFLYTGSCESCHGNANSNWTGSGGTIICVSATAFNSAFQTGGKMDGVIANPPDQQGLGDIYNYVTSVTGTCA